MNVFQVPFNKYIGLQKSDKENYLLLLKDRSEFKNHLGTVHASTMFALAEATSGEFLLDQFKDLKMDIIPVVRKAEIKYSKPGQSSIYSKAGFVNQSVQEITEELKTKKRVIIKVKVDIFGESDEKLMASVFDWFVSTK